MDVVPTPLPRVCIRSRPMMIETQVFQASAGEQHESHEQDGIAEHQVSQAGIRCKDSLDPEQALKR